jgi:hypothetical protein
MAGDLHESWQQVRATYQDILGEPQHTDWISDSDYYFGEGDQYRRKTVRLENVSTSTGAENLIQRFLDENKQPKKSARYQVHDGSVFTAEGVPVPVDELKATGGLVKIEDWRSVETGDVSTDLRTNWTTEQVVGVEVDYENGTANLIPASAKSTFERYMAELARIKAQ